MGKTNIYDKTLRVCTDYLGPAAERFLMRQIDTHLHKKPDELNSSDLKDLVVWMVLAMGMLTDDGKMVDEFKNRLMKVATQRVS